MPAKKTQITDAERAANIRKLAREVRRAMTRRCSIGRLRKIVQHRPDQAKPSVAKK